MGIALDSDVASTVQQAVPIASRALKEIMDAIDMMATAELPPTSAQLSARTQQLKEQIRNFERVVQRKQVGDIGGVC
jgi:hypothetical protein